MSRVDVVLPSALRRLDDVVQGQRTARHGIASPPHAVQTAFFRGIPLVLFVVDAVGHVGEVVFLAVVGQDEPRPLGKRHRQVTHVTAMLDLHGKRLVINGLASQGPKKVAQRRQHTRFRFIIPKDLQDHIGDGGDVEVGHLARTFQVGQHHLLAFGYGPPVIFDIGSSSRVANVIQITQLLGSPHRGEQIAQHRRGDNAHNQMALRHSQFLLGL